MRIKILCIAILIILFSLFLMYLYPNKKNCYVKKVISPCEIVLDSGEIFKFKDYETFDANFSAKNAKLAELNGLSEEEAFVIGNFAHDWAANILTGRKINVQKTIFLIINSVIK